MTGLAMRTHRHSERGAELIEFALVLPLLLAIVAGIIDFGFLFQRHIVLQNAAREAARVRVLPSYGDADARARALAYVNEGLGLGLTGDATPPGWTFTVTIASVDTDAGGPHPAFTVARVQVGMRHNYLILGPIMSLLGAAEGSFGSIPLAAESTMRREA